MNKRLNNIEISGIRKFLEKVQKVDGAISLTIGQPDFKLPEVVKESIIQALQDGKTEYTSNHGLLELREAISEYLKKQNIYFSPSEICITVGGSEGLYSVFTALLNEGDKILIPNPSYPAYKSIAGIIGAEVVTYLFNEDLSINMEYLRKKVVDENIKYMVLSYPSNPTGAILTKEQRDKLVTLIKETGLIVITDEMYSSICFGEYYTIAQDESVKENIIYVSGFSKMLSMTGLRVGYVACSEKYMNSILKVHQYNVACATSISQYGALGGIKYAQRDMELMNVIFKKRRDYCYSRLIKMGVDVIMPEGAFYIFPSIKRYGLSSEEFCERLLKEEKVACVPGTAFGINGEGYIRISYCYSDDVLEEGLNRFEKFIKKLKNKREKINL